MLIRNLLAIVLGIVVGILFKGYSQYYKLLGDSFINIVKMVAVPMIFFSIVRSFATINTSSNVRRIITRTFSCFFVMALLATSIGVFSATFILNDGNVSGVAGEAKSLFSVIVEVLQRTLPINFIAPFLQENVVQVVMLSALFAYVVSKTTSKDKVIPILFTELSDLMFGMMNLIIKLTPYGVFGYAALIASTTNSKELVKYTELLTVMVSSYSLVFILMFLIIKFVIRLSPTKFFRKSFEYQVLAFSTGSGKGALTYAIRTSIERLGISYENANLLIPLGVSVSLTGSTVYFSTATIFMAKMYSINLGVGEYITILIMSLIIPMGASGIVGGGMMVLPVMLNVLGIPTEAMVFLAAIDPIINGVRTVTNVTSDVMIALYVDKKENTLNEDVFSS